MSKKPHNIIVVKKSKSHGGGHHGGSWKIAYADFMTAMMAFFLVMWLLSNSTPQERQHIAEYFKAPVNVALSNGDKNSLSDSVIPGGGDDMLKQDGEELRYEDNTGLQDLGRLKDKIEELINVDPRLNDFKSNLLLTIIDSGLLIQIIDSQERPMFKVGSKKPEEYMVHILQALVPILNDIPNRMTLTGHTDSLPYANGEVGYSNWELSSDRSNASRQVLVNGGLHADKVLQVIGVASNMSMGDSQPDAPANRRITLLILTKSKEKEIFQEDSLIQSVNTGANTTDVQSQLKLPSEPDRSESQGNE
ncbi:flagellar motor protein MotB [Yersinia massiliensis]|uniref:flagellar motor protein MotB n=1 Tax=Yersinia massiliensis TaxID=419257 RepID=UPI0011A224CF|nr:flagellar motor protein MotB [Yersinia massiliensis]